MRTSYYPNFQKTFLLCGLSLLFCFSISRAQDRQGVLMPGTYRLSLQATPLYYFPHSIFRAYHGSVLHIQTIPFRELREWGTQFAIVSRDSTNGQRANNIVFLNAQVDTNSAEGFVSQQTEALQFEECDSTMQLIPTYGKNPLERPHSASFNLQYNWFSLYHTHTKSSSWNDFLDESVQRTGTKLIVEAAAFNLFRPIALQQIIFNNTTDSIPLYTQTDTLSRPEAWFLSDENIFVHKDSLNGLWLKVSQFELVPNSKRRRISTDAVPIPCQLQETMGWVRKEDLYRRQWEQHTTELPGIQFEVTGIDPNTDDDYYTRGMLAAIKVIDKNSNQTTQVITDIGAEITDSLSRCLHFLDANFDGYSDIMSSYADGGSGPNYTNIFYLFDPTSKQFIYNDSLSALPQVEVDTLRQVIRSAWRAGAGQHGAAEYRFINGKMEHTYQWDQAWGAGYFTEETESVRQPDGQWKETIIYGSEVLADTVSIYRKPKEKQVALVRMPGSFAYFRILDENDLWFYIETDQADTTIEGWIHKEALFPDQWEELSVPFADYEFEKVEDDYGNLLALRIRNQKSGKPLQIIGPINNGYRSGHFEAGDYNHDGRMDFQVHFIDEETKPKSVVFLFDKRSKHFVKTTD